MQARLFRHLRALRDHSTAFTVDLLGETVLSEREAEVYAARYLELIKALAMPRPRGRMSSTL